MVHVVLDIRLSDSNHKGIPSFKLRFLGKAISKSGLECYVHVFLTNSKPLRSTCFVGVDGSDIALLFEPLLEAVRIVRHLGSRTLQSGPAWKIITNLQDDLNLRLCVPG